MMRFDGGFFPTSDQRDLIMKSLDHLMGCDCTSDKDIETGFELIDIMLALMAVSPNEIEELQDMAKSWDDPGEAE